MFAVPTGVITVNIRFSVARNLEEINPDVVKSSLVSLETQVNGKTFYLKQCIVIILCQFVPFLFITVQLLDAIQKYDASIQVYIQCFRVEK